MRSGKTFIVVSDLMLAFILISTPSTDIISVLTYANGPADLPTGCLSQLLFIMHTKESFLVLLLQHAIISQSTNFQIQALVLLNPLQEFLYAPIGTHKITPRDDW